MRLVKYFFLLFFVCSSALAQTDSLSYTEFLDMVISEHPVVSQAGLVSNIGDAEVQSARGAFDPRFEVDYKGKEYKGTEYYDLLDAQLQVPMWYGLKLKGGFQQNQGAYLNPQNELPDAGLFSAGVVLSLGEGLWINSRMAGLRKAQAYREQSEAEQQLMVNDILLEASFVYFEWIRAQEKLQIFEDFLENANERYSGIRRQAQTGALAGIDTVEARLALQKRRLQANQAEVDLRKIRLELSTFLWDQDQPLILQEQVLPSPTEEIFITLLSEVPEAELSSHPQLEFYRRKIEALQIERRYRFNALLPQIDLEYNFLSEEPDNFETFNPGAYKAGLRFSMPLFLRKERGDLRIAEYELEDAKLELSLKDQQLQAKIAALQQQIQSFIEQTEMIDQMVGDASALLGAEIRKFNFGESSIFLINARESRLIEARLEQLDLQTKYLKTQAEYLQVLGTNPVE
ncbi:TolC family protein [Salegentibacter sp. Hel_I_6]|uniref:TolC family protein n=1 Tax=Salegentibacter sp. Hel_I_6 TaxID=1250278 RepID=UPI00055FA550|nr:TolC family protein [Salegentibacter sp. Hel_I_6]